MSKLFIYYSLTGSGEVVANKMKEKGYELRKVTEKYKMPKVFFFRVLFGGFRAGVNAKAKLIDYNSDVSEYDEIVIGSPIWNGKFPPVLNSILSVTDFKDKKLTFLFYSGSGDQPKALDKALKLYPEANHIVLKDPKSHEEELEKLRNLH